ncbi:hypothetical protein D9M71_528690 [compost metagenome]
MHGIGALHRADHGAGVIALGARLGDLATVIGRHHLVRLGRGSLAGARRGRRCGMAVAVAGVLAIGALRQVRVQFELGQHAAGGNDVAGTAGQLQHLAGKRRGHFNHGLGGLHGDQRLVERDHVAFLDEPLDDGGVGQAFAEVGQVEILVLTHVHFSSSSSRSRAGSQPVAPFARSDHHQPPCS